MLCYEGAEPRDQLVEGPADAGRAHVGGARWRRPAARSTAEPLRSAASHRCTVRECRSRYDVAADPTEHAPLDEPDTLAELRALLDARNQAYHSIA